MALRFVESLEGLRRVKRVSLVGVVFLSNEVPWFFSSVRSVRWGGWKGEGKRLREDKHKRQVRLPWASKMG